MSKLKKYISNTTLDIFTNIMPTFSSITTKNLAKPEQMLHKTKHGQFKGLFHDIFIEEKILVAAGRGFYPESMYEAGLGGGDVHFS